MHHTEEIGIERRLIEDLGAEPVAGRELARPAIVARRVAEQEVAEGGGAELPDVDEAYEQGRREDRGQRRCSDGRASRGRPGEPRGATAAALVARPAPLGGTSSHRSPAP